MSHNHPASGNAKDGRNPAITAAWIGAAAVVVAALITVVFHSGHGTSPTPSATTTIGGTAASGTPAPSQAPSPTPVSPVVYWQGAVGITLEPGGINFDLKPATTSADSPTNISFDENTLENYYVGTTILVSQWTSPGRPTRAQCANQVLTHPTHSVSNVAEGMQICIRTTQGRFGRLTVTSISSDDSTLNVMAVIWN
jgi:hypothetical protein